MRTKRCQRVVWMVLLGLVVGGMVWHTSVLAQDQSLGACAQDAQKFCPAARTPQARTQCLKSHEAELSPGCKELQARAAHARAKAQQKTITLQDACKSETETLCQDVKPGGGGSGIAQCLKAHEADLSATCKDALSQGKGKTSRASSVREGARR